MSVKKLMPKIGLGTWQLTGNTCIESVITALELGYRHIDTADIYGNHMEVGKALSSSGVNRSDLFLTSKVWRTNLEKQRVIDSCKKNLGELAADYLDLYLVHWPNKDIPIQETLEGMSILKEQGLIRAFGVSNFTIKHLEEFINDNYQVEVNQVEFHPSLNQKELKSYCDQHNILITAYSPIAQGDDLKIPEINMVAKANNAEPAQIILKWLMDLGMAVIPRSTKSEHLKSNLESMAINLSPDDLKVLDNLNTGHRLVAPDFNEFHEDSTK